MPKYRKKPVVIEAEQLLPGKESYDRMTALFGEEPGEKYGYVMGTIRADGRPDIPVFELWIRSGDWDEFATPGDYIVKEDTGVFSICKEDIFHLTYEEVPHG